MSALCERIDQVESIKMGMGIQYLLTEAYKIFGNPLLLFDMDNKLIKYYQQTDVKGLIWNEIIKNGTFSNQTIAFFKSEGIIDDVAAAPTIALIQSEKLSNDVLVGKIYCKNRTMVASLLMLANDRPFETQDPVLFEAFCEVLSKEIITIDYYLEYTLAYRDTTIGKFIDGNIPDKVLFACHAANIYEGFHGNICVGVLDTTEYDPDRTRLAAIRETIKQIHPGVKCAIYSDFIVIILGIARETISIKDDLQKLHRFFKQKRIYAGISECFDNVYEFSKYYHQAVSALRNGKEYAGDRHIFLYGEE